MMNLSEMVAIVRRDLKDEDQSNYRWTDEELERHIGHALKDVSICSPLESKATLATTAGTREINIANLVDRLGVESVEYPAGLNPARQRHFSIWNDTLTLIGKDVPDGSDCVIFYIRLHTLDDQGSTIPAKYEDLLADGACGYAAVAWAGYAINRINNGGSGTPKELLNWGQAKLASFKEGLRKLGQKNKVRVNRMYRNL